MAMVETASLWVDRAKRQRTEIDKDHVQSLANSFLRIGQLQAIIYADTGEIIAGEHRWEAARFLGWTHLKAELDEGADENLRQAMELEENVKRLDMTWQDQAIAILRYHEQRVATEAGWTQAKTAEALGFDEGTISKNLSAAKEIELGNEKITSAPKLSAASNVLSRRQARESDSEAVRALTVERTVAAPTVPTGQGSKGPADRSLPVTVTPPAEPDKILNENFLEWAPKYEGPLFNFLHCDFPYGVNLDKSDQAGAAQQGAYKDTPETYWALLDCLADNWERIMLPSAHIMFWFSMDFYTDTLAFFSRRIPQLTVDAFPLYWLKSNGKGILPDPNRGPRRIVETCLFGRTGDRKIVQAVGNGYACPTVENSDKLHISEKPEPMLRNFFRMLVDENTAMLDPTAGGGSALRAADSLRAAYTLGLELNPEYAAAANVALKRAKLLRKVTTL